MNIRGRRMFGWSMRCIRWLGIVLVAVISADARAQNPGSNAKVITWTPPASGEVYVGILGEIDKPGVYHLDNQSLSLQSVIRKAGGLKDEASGTIRIIRQDRICESLFFSPQLERPLLAGDLLVIESKRTQAAISKKYESDPQIRSRYARGSESPIAPDDSTVVQVAFVNVLDRPVIVKVKPENARLAHLVQMLAQPIELAQAVRVIGPERLLTQSAEAQPIYSTLSDGSVLVFPRNSVNRSKLPAMPLPYDSEIATGAKPSLIGSPSGQSPELRNVGQLPLMARPQFAQAPGSLDQMTIPTPPPAIPPVSAPLSEQLIIPPSTNPVPVVSSSPRIATVPFSGERRITSSSQHATNDDEAAKPVIPDRNANRQWPTRGTNSESLDREKGLKKTRLQIDESGELREDEDVRSTDIAKSSSFSWTNMLAISACVALLIAVALLTRRYFDRLSPVAPGLIAEIEAALQLSATNPSAKIDIEQTIATAAGSSPATPLQVPVVSSSALWLDQLLNNQLPIREEPLEFPRQIVLQGRIVPPPVFRVDKAASMAKGPHFAMTAEQEPESAIVMKAPQAPEMEQVIEDFDGPHGSRPSKPHFMLRRPGENTVAAKAAAAAGTTNFPSVEPELKSSLTPVADALRHLQGGQS